MLRIWMTRTLALLAAPIAALALATPANAQWDYGGPPVMDWLTPHLQAQQWCNVSWCRVDDDASSSPPTAEERARERRRAHREARAERRREQRAKARERQKLRRNARKLRFVPVPEVSERVRAHLIANFAPGDTPTDVQLRAQFEAMPPLQVFNQWFDASWDDWSARDAADMYAGSLILMWLAIDEDADRTTTAVDEAVRADIRAGMAAAPAVWKAGDADQQELAERIASWTAVLAGQFNWTVQQGDALPPGAPSVEEFRETLVDLGQSSHLFGVDLSAVKLTRNGIVPR
jgi:hypothetical protein